MTRSSTATHDASKPDATITHGLHVTVHVTELPVTCAPISKRGISAHGRLDAPQEPFQALRRRPARRLPRGRHGARDRRRLPPHLLARRILPHHRPHGLRHILLLHRRALQVAPRHLHADAPLGHELRVEELLGAQRPPEQRHAAGEALEDGVPPAVGQERARGRVRQDPHLRRPPAHQQPRARPRRSLLEAGREPLGLERALRVGPQRRAERPEEAAAARLQPQRELPHLIRADAVLRPEGYVQHRARRVRVQPPDDAGVVPRVRRGRRREDRPDRPRLDAEASSEHVEAGGFQFPDGVDEDRVGLAAEGDDAPEEGRPGVRPRRGEHVPRDLRALEHDAREVRQRELVGGRAGVREVLPHGEEHGVAERAASEEHDVGRAPRARDVGRPPEEGVGDDADRGTGTDARDELLERGAERLGGLEEGDELVDLDVGQGVGARGQAVVGGREGERVEAQGRGRRREGEGAQDARGGDERDLEPRAARAEEVGQAEEGGDVAVRQEREEDDVWAYLLFRHHVDGWRR
jgi:hypothetical protein